MILSTSVSKKGRRETDFDKYIKECDEKIASIDAEIAELQEGASVVNLGGRSKAKRIRLDPNDPNKA